jgi:hypothetical protein
MAPQQQQERGVIAILDALGAANYSEKEIARFLRSRELVLGLLNEKAETVLGEIDADLVTTFTFNDTVVVVYRINRRATLKDVQAFCTLLRKFIIDPLVHMILFRGSISFGRSRRLDRRKCHTSSDDSYPVPDRTGTEELRTFDRRLFGTAQ